MFFFFKDLNEQGYVKYTLGGNKMKQKLIIRRLAVTIDVPVSWDNSITDLSVVHLLEEYADELIECNHFSEGKDVDDVTKFLRIQKPDDISTGVSLRNELVSNPKSYVSGCVEEFEYGEEDIFYIGILSDPNEQGERSQTNVPCIKTPEGGGFKYTFLYNDNPIATSLACLDKDGDKFYLNESDILAVCTKLEEKERNKFKEFLQQFV